MDTSTPNISELRQDYQLAELTRHSVAADPFTQFRQWFAEAQTASIVEPNAMILATVDLNGQPSTRTVLLKALDDRGFTFFTNYQSRKGMELDRNPRAALTFFWKELERQVNIRGVVEKTSPEESEVYFRSRPYASQIGALASLQSASIPNREWLETRFNELSAQHPEGNVPRPEHWGGYRLLPSSIEFWQGRRSRLHDRLTYVPESSAPSGWEIHRLSP